MWFPWQWYSGNPCTTQNRCLALWCTLEQLFEEIVLKCFWKRTDSMDLSIPKLFEGSGEMAQWLRVTATLHYSLCTHISQLTTPPALHFRGCDAVFTCTHNTHTHRNRDKQIHTNTGCFKYLHTKEMANKFQRGRAGNSTHIFAYNISKC